MYRKGSSTRFHCLTLHCTSLEQEETSSQHPVPHLHLCPVQHCHNLGGDLHFATFSCIMHCLAPSHTAPCCSHALIHEQYKPCHMTLAALHCMKNYAKFIATQSQVPSLHHLGSTKLEFIRVNFNYVPTRCERVFSQEIRQRMSQLI